MMVIPITINDMETILDCDGSVSVCHVWVHQSDCSNRRLPPTQPCDDGDDCTENDMETILDSDGSDLCAM